MGIERWGIEREGVVVGGNRRELAERDCGDQRVGGQGEGAERERGGE